MLESPGTGGTDLLVNNGAQFISTARFDGDVDINGTLSITNFNLNSSSSNVIAGIVTASEIRVGTGGSVFTVTGKWSWYWI